MILRNFHWFLHIPANQKPQTSVLLSIDVSSVVEQTLLRHLISKSSVTTVWY